MLKARWAWAVTAMVVAGSASIRMSAADDATTAPAAAPGLGSEYVVSPPRVQQMAATNYLYVSMQTSLAKIGDIATSTMKTLTDARGAGKFRSTGAPIFIYHNVTPDPQAMFTLD